MPALEPVDSALFFSRQDASDPRLGELVKPAPHEQGVAVIGYPDDEGIRMNGGRPGSAEGPTEIRRWLYKMTPHARRPLKAFWDLGDLTPDSSIEERHEHARRIVAESLRAQQQVLALGGGNDYSYADGMGFLDACTRDEGKPLIINIDAHLDVRDTSRGLTSGTPFYRLLESGQAFDFLEIGIQAQCNAQAHWEYVEEKGGRILSLDEIHDSGVSLTEFTTQTCGDLFLRSRPAYIALDMDAFAWPYAIGTSASWPMGLDPVETQKMLQMLMRRLNVKVFGIYETSPPLDQGAGTAKLAAQLAHGFLHYV